MTTRSSDPIEALLDKVTSVTDAEHNAWQRFGLNGNPFPSRAQPIWEVFHNQNRVRDRFVEVLRDFVDGTAQNNNTRTMLFTGGNRVGKTHFMEHHRRYVVPRLTTRGLAVPTALVSAELCDAAGFVRAVLDQIEVSLRGLTGSGLFETAPSPELAVELQQKMPAGGLREALTRWKQGDNDHGDLLRRWYSGERLRLPHRTKLGVSFLLDSFAPLVGALAGTIAYLRAKHTTAPRCPGVLVFVDEFERVFNARRDRQGAFLQALRSILDASAGGGLLLCVGMAVDVGPTLQQVEEGYPALYERLKGAQEIPALTQIAGVVDALGYAHAFIEHARTDQAAKHVLITDAEIEQTFRKVARQGSSVAQGSFFDALHEHAEQRAHETRAPKPSR